jgi:acetoin utilization deacetylase AcuC-like enzyme
MYARVVWGLRKVAVLEVGGSFGRGTHELLKGVKDVLFVSAHVRGPDDPADCEGTGEVIHTLAAEEGAG